MTVDTEQFPKTIKAGAEFSGFRYKISQLLWILDIFITEDRCRMGGKRVNKMSLNANESDVLDGSAIEKAVLNTEYPYMFS